MREKDGNLIRPLLCVKKEEIVKYLKEAGQAWVEDASNQDDAFARIRSTLSATKLFAIVAQLACSPWPF